MGVFLSLITVLKKVMGLSHQHLIIKPIVIVIVVTRTKISVNLLMFIKIKGKKLLYAEKVV